VDPPGYTYTTSNAWNCQFCAHRRDIKGWASCAKYECRTLLNSLCESFEARGEKDVPEATSREMKRLDGPWMKVPKRAIPPDSSQQDMQEDLPWRKSRAGEEAS